MQIVWLQILCGAVIVQNTDLTVKEYPCKAEIEFK